MLVGCVRSKRQCPTNLQNQKWSFDPRDGFLMLLCVWSRKSLATSSKQLGTAPWILSLICCSTVGYWRLLLKHSTIGDECSTSKNAKDSLRSWFWILKVTSKIWVLEQTQSTLLSRRTNMKILSVVICVMNVKDQACQWSVTCSCPRSDWSSMFVCFPWSVWSTISYQVQTFQDKLRAYIG